jgi:hypothetical protein
MKLPEILAECFVTSYKCRRSGSRLCPFKSVRKVDDELLSLRSVSRTDAQRRNARAAPCGAVALILNLQHGIQENGHSRRTEKCGH